MHMGSHSQRMREPMRRKSFLLLLIPLLFVLSHQTGSVAQESPNFHVVVNMVQLNVAVTDKKGNYVTSLKPSDFEIVEDGIVEKAATFGEGNEPVRNLGDVAGPAASPDGKSLGAASGTPTTFHDLINGANVFILFDT